jgi:hypothetical protein
LLRAILKNKHTYSSDEHHDLEIKLQHVLETIENEIRCPYKKESISYIDLAGIEIEKLLQTAKMKKKERMLMA